MEGRVPKRCRLAQSEVSFLTHPQPHEDSGLARSRSAKWLAEVPRRRRHSLGPELVRGMRWPKEVSNGQISCRVGPLLPRREPTRLVGLNRRLMLLLAVAACFCSRRLISRAVSLQSYPTRRRALSIVLVSGLSLWKNTLWKLVRDVVWSSCRPLTSARLKLKSCPRSKSGTPRTLSSRSQQTERR